MSYYRNDPTNGTTSKPTRRQNGATSSIILRTATVLLAISTSHAVRSQPTHHIRNNPNNRGNGKIEQHAEFHQEAIDPSEHRISQLKQSRDSRRIRQLSPSIGDNIRALVLLVKFPEHDIDVLPLPTREYFDTMCNTQIVPYFQKQSYGRYNIVACDVQEWKETDYSQEFYSSSLSNLVGSEFASDFFIPVLEQLDVNNTNGQTFDWTIYDTDQDGTLDAVIALHSGFGAEYRNIGDCNISDFNNRIHSQGHNDSSGDWYDETVDGYQPWTNSDNTISLSGYAIASVYDFICTDTPATPGVITHEWIHIFGTPDLYGMIVGASVSDAFAIDTGTSKISTVEVDLKVRGLGSYDVMSNARGPLIDGQPSSLSVYTKYLIGWMTPVEILSDGIYTLKPSNTDPNSALVIRHPLFAFGEYLLIEYRSASEYDVNLFGGGLLIYHVDDNQRVQGGSTLPYGSAESHLKVAVIQSDGKYDIELGINNGDEGDFWKAGMTFEPSGVNTTKDELFYPNTDSYYNGRTGLSLYVLNVTSDGDNNDTAYATLHIQGIGDINSSSNSTMPPVDTLSPTPYNQTPTISPSSISSDIDSDTPSELVSNVPSAVPSYTITLVIPDRNIPTTSSVLPMTTSPTLQAPIQAPTANINLDDSNNDSMASRSYESNFYCATSLLIIMLLFL